jgi:hypothetical protein
LVFCMQLAQSGERALMQRLLGRQLLLQVTAS